MGSKNWFLLSRIEASTSEKFSTGAASKSPHFVQVTDRSSPCYLRSKSRNMTAMGCEESSAPHECTRECKFSDTNSTTKLKLCLARAPSSPRPLLRRPLNRSLWIWKATWWKCTAPLSSLMILTCSRIAVGTKRSSRSEMEGESLISDAHIVTFWSNGDNTFSSEPPGRTRAKRSILPLVRSISDTVAHSCITFKRHQISCSTEHSNKWLCWMCFLVASYKSSLSILKFPPQSTSETARLRVGARGRENNFASRRRC